MQSEHQHIDDFFRAKEEAWNAGSEHLQQHWQQMLILMPAAATGVDSKPSYYRLMKFGSKLLVGVVTIAVLVTLVIILSKRDEAGAEQPVQKNEAAVAAVAEQAPKQDTVFTVQANPSSATVTAPAPPQKMLPRLRRGHTPVAGADTATIEVPPVKPDAAILLKEFYNAIKKESQP